MAVGLRVGKREECWIWNGLWGLLCLGDGMGWDGIEGVGGAEMMGWWDGCLGRGVGDVSWREKLVIGIVDVVVVLSSVDVEGLGEVERSLVRVL